MVKTMAKKNNNYLIQGSILAVSSIIVRFIGMLYKIPITRIIGDEGMGNYNSAQEIYNLALLLSSYSIPLVVSKLISAREAMKQYKNSIKILNVAMLTAAVLGFTASLVVYLGAETWAKITKFEDSSIALKVLAPTIFIFAIMGVLRGLFQGKNTMMPTAVSQIIEQIVNAVVSIAASYYLMKEHNASERVVAYGAAGGTAGTFFGALAAFLFLGMIFIAFIPYLKNRASKDTISNESYGDAAKVFFVALFPVILSQTVYNLSGTIDSAMFGNIMKWQNITSSEITTLFGVYSNKYRQLTNLPVAIATALGTAIVPTLAINYSRNDIEGVKTKIHSSVKLNMLISIPAAVGMAVFAEPIILIIYTGRENFELSTNLLRIGSCAVVLFALSTLTNGILQGINKMKLPVTHAAISLGIHIVLLFIMLGVLKIGAYGLVIGNVTFALIVCILNWIAIARHIEYKQEVIKTFLIPLAASAVMGVVSLGIYDAIKSILKSVKIAFVAAFLVAVVTYCILVVLMRAFNKEEMLELPKGYHIYKLCKKFHLMK